MRPQTQLKVVGRAPGSLLGALLACALLCALATLAAPRPLYAENGWSEPFDVSNDQFGWFPDLAADAQGAVHVIWGSGATNPDADPNSPDASQDLLRYRVLRDGVWSGVNDIAYTCVGGFTVRNSIVANRDGRVNVLVRNCFDVSAFDAPGDMAWSAGAWGRLQRLGTSYYNAIAADSKGVLHAIYNEGLVGTVDGVTPLSEIFYRRSTDGGQTWSVRNNLARLPGGDERMQIRVDGRDRIHVVWDHGSDWYLGIDEAEYGVYRRSDDGGETWRETTLLGVSEGPTVQTTLGLMGDGNPLVVYRSAFDTKLYYQTSLDGGDSWTPGQPVPYIQARDVLERNLDSYSMATDSAGRIHLLVSGFPEGSAAAIPMLLHLTYDGQSWSPPEVVSATANRPLWPRLVAYGGNQLHAVWFSYTDATGWGERRVWYSGKTLDTPAAPPPPPITLPTAPAPTAQPPDDAPVEPIAAAPDQGGASAASVPAQPSAPVGAFRDTPPPGSLGGTQSFVVPALALLPVAGLIVALAAMMIWRRTRGQ